MLVVFEGSVRVTYAVLFLQVPGSDHDDVDEDDPQRDWSFNGLCSVAHRHGVILETGRHDGMVEIRVEVHASAPPRQLGWDEVVECSARFDRTDLELTGDGGTPDSAAPAVAVGLPATGLYRLRFCADGMDAAVALDGGPPEAAGPDRYLLQLWPAPFAPDRVLRETSRRARQNHERTRRLFPIPIKPSGGPRRP